jgi:hypothetical protein
MKTTSLLKPKNRPLDPSRRRSFGISVLLTAFAMGVCIAAETIQTTGVPGSPSATTTIDGKQLPPPDPTFGGVINEKASESKPWWPPTVVPSLVGRLLLGAELAGASIPVARVTGIALIALGVSCLPRSVPGRLGQALVGMLTYSLLVTLYLLYLGVRGEWVGPLLWPAVAVHAVLTMVLVVPRMGILSMEIVATGKSPLPQAAARQTRESPPQKTVRSGQSLQSRSRKLCQINLEIGRLYAPHSEGFDSALACAPHRNAHAPTPSLCARL